MASFLPLVSLHAAAENRSRVVSDPRVAVDDGDALGLRRLVARPLGRFFQQGWGLAHQRRPGRTSTREKFLQRAIGDPPERADVVGKRVAVPAQDLF
jgi:hypothetical protein